MRSEKHTQSHFNVAFACEKGNGTSQNTEHDDVEHKNNGGEGKANQQEKHKCNRLQWSQVARLRNSLL